MLRTATSVLLLQDTDPGLTGVSWWTTPGGGIEPGETDETAAVREVAEETGLVVATSRLRGPIATRVVHHGFSDQITIQHEVFYELPLPHETPVSTAGYTDSERLTLVGHRWWPIDELATTTHTIWPANLTRLLRLPGSPGLPLDLGVIEESSVPIRPLR